MKDKGTKVVKGWLGLAMVISLCSAAGAAAPNPLNLGGQWRFELDRDGRGLAEKWYQRELSGSVKLPGSLPAQGIGDDVTLETKWTGGIQDPKWYANPVYAPYTKPDNFKFPFWLQPDKYYSGKAWYQRAFEAPQDWSGKRVTLRLERPHWATTVWLDGRELGSNRSLSAPHVYELGVGLTPGNHTLTILVDNGMVVDIGENSHAVTDHTQGNWNGIVGSMQLEATPSVWVEGLEVYPSLKDQSVRVKGRIGNASGAVGNGTLLVAIEEAVADSFRPREWTEIRVSWNAAGGTFEQTLEAPGAKPWDEFRPTMFYLLARLKDQEQSVSTPFGFRDLGTEGTQLTINGQRTFMRGTLECGIFPLTGHPPTEVDYWRRIIRTAKAHGLNMFRFHSYCPPEAAFQAADFEGFYYQVETCWANQSTTIGDGKPVDQWVYEETDAILKAYGNHPSFLLMAHGNEPGGNNYTQYLAKYLKHFEEKDPRRLWTSGSGWPQLPENQFHVTPDPRIQGWGEGLKSRINAKPPETTTDYRDYISQRKVPVISHEIGQWCVYPNFDEIPKYKGYLKPKNFEIFQDTLAANGMKDQARDFLLASGKLQALCYKEDIESALRTPGMAGFQLLDLHDFPGQGTALVGVLDPFWEYKGYIKDKEYRRFCDATVPLARLGKRVFTTDETLQANLEAAHFGPAPRANVITRWQLLDGNLKAVASGRFEPTNLPIGNCIPLGTVAVDLAKLQAPARYQLVVTLEEGNLEGFTFRGRLPDRENDWDIWVYPKQTSAPIPEGIRVVNELDAETGKALEDGGRVLLMIPPANVKGDAHGKVGLGFSSIFWNTAWTGRQPPHTLGILCDPKTPALGLFPTEHHSNWQWWYLISQSGAMILDALPKDLRPTVQVIDDWVTNRRLGLLFEAKVGKGRLMVCSMDLKKNVEANPVARQMLESILAYMSSSSFKPAVSLTTDQVRGLATEANRMSKLGARVQKVSSFQRGYEPENLLDGDPSTLWHTTWTPVAPRFPHEVQIAFEKPTQLTGLRLLPRSDGNANGRIDEYEVYVSQDGLSWGEAIALGGLDRGEDAKNITFSKPVQARFLRLVVLSGHGNGPWASLAELEALTAPER